MSLASRVDQYNHEFTYLWGIGPKPVESDPNSVEFSQLLQDLNSQASKSYAKDNFDYLKLGTISKEQAYNSLKNISEKMDEVIENAKNQGDEVLFEKLSLLKNFHFKNTLGGYTTTLASLENSTNKLTSLSSQDLAKELENINNNLSVANMILGGVADIAEVFFAIAGVTDVQDDINILKKYHMDSQTQIELNNGTILRVSAVREMAENVDSKFSKIAEDKKNSLLETLLQTI
ncbi:hypothetical protein [Campylobacter estrildidarum]|uniref:Uncharacterized protein n=1 Tax=Campylobacter estrildidarum TaxID=2510189 RepID=A0A4U7BEA7_9BACT|nr:hypothetical protein [Campylobacter estrildidarum]TKX29943.1 hypothetical protein CQA69_07165 [Campylobacter estrildidarum]